MLQARDDDSHRKQGILVAAHSLRDEGDLEAYEHKLLREVLSWFNAHLTVPKCLNDYDHRRAISWFKSEAREPIDKIWELLSVLRNHGFEVELLKTSDPGIVILNRPGFAGDLIS